MSGLNLQGGYGAGAGQDALKDLIKQKFLQQIESRRASEAQQHFAMQGGAQELQARGQDMAQGRFDTGRNDQLATAEGVKSTADAKAARIVGIINDPNTPPAVKLALQYQDATGSNAPAGIFDKPAAAPQRPMSVAPGGTLVDPATGKVMFKAPERPATPGAGSRMWVMRNGQPVRVSDAEIQPGDSPVSSRDQGRPVTSGDAGNLADFDTSLDDLKVLRETLTGPNSTGAASKVGAMMPNFITEATGIGGDAKARQATIDRVKQVIGKTLEGGVLRKEDELKYEKILPTIGDPPDVVKAKLAGLEQAITLRKGRQVDALDDAGYETSKFRSRGGAAAPAPKGGVQQKAIPGIPGGVAEMRDGKWVRVK